MVSSTIDVISNNLVEKKMTKIKLELCKNSIENEVVVSVPRGVSELINAHYG